MAVGNIQNNGSTPYVVTPNTPGAVGGTSNVATVTQPGETQGVRPPGGLSVSVAAGEVSYSSPNLEGIDWDALSSDFHNIENLSVSISAIMVLMIDVMKEMRKGQREAWMEEAQNALQMGMNAADRMRESAAAKLASDVVSNAASMATAAISLVSSASSLRSSSLAEKRIDAKATELFGPAKDVKFDAGATPTTPSQTQQPTQLEIEAQTPSTGASSPDGTPTTSALSTDGAQTPTTPDVPATQGVQATAGTTTASTTPESQTATGTTGGSDGAAKPSTTGAGASETSETPDSPNAKKDGPNSTGAQESAVKDSNAQTADLENQQKRAQYVSQQRSLHQSQFDQKVNIAKAVTEIGAGLAKIGGSVGEYFAGTKQAEAKEFEALGAYSQALMQAELEFANQMRDAIRTIIDTMKGAEQAKHQAMQGIYNI
jgi:hypothetical protein